MLLPVSWACSGPIPVREQGNYAGVRPGQVQVVAFPQDGVVREPGTVEETLRNLRDQPGFRDPLVYFLHRIDQQCMILDRIKPCHDSNKLV